MNEQANQTDAVSRTSGTKSSLDRALGAILRIGAGRDVRLFAWVLLALAAGFVAYTARMHEITHDAFHEMALYRQALIQGEMPQVDVFAFTPTVDTSVHHEWGTGAVLYWATVGSGLGLAGLSLLKFGLIAALWFVLYRIARLRGAHPIVFGCIAFAVFPVMWVGFATVRAQLFTLLALALQLWMLESDWRGRRMWVFAWLVVLTCWLNLHAGFVVGLGLLAFHTAERFVWTAWQTRSFQATFAQCWHLLPACVGSLCVLPINPYGWKYIPYLIRAISMPRPLIREWKPIWHTYAPELTIFMLMVAVVMIGLSIRHYLLRRDVSRLRGLAFLTICLLMTIKHIRHGSLLAVVWLAYVPAWISRLNTGRLLTDWLENNRHVSIRICQVITVGCLAFASVHHFWRPSLPPAPLYSTACFPVAAVDYLQENDFQGNLFTPFHVGAYVSWEMHPHVKVSFDGRYEVAYRAGVMEEHNTFLAGKAGWWELLEKYHTDGILVHRDAPLYKFALKTLGGDSSECPPELADWEICYADDSFLIAVSGDWDLPVVDDRGQALPDGAIAAFSPEHHHSRRDTHPRPRLLETPQSLPVSTTARDRNID